MNTPPDVDPDLLDLVRRADPIRDARAQANAGLDTESALRLLAPELDRPGTPAGPSSTPDGVAYRSARRRGRCHRVRGRQRRLERERLRGLASAGTDPQTHP